MPRPIKNSDLDQSPRWFLHVHHVDRRFYWARLEPIPGEPNMHSMQLNPSAMLAEAFKERERQQFCDLIPMTYPGAEVLAIKCDSNQLIPDHLRKVIRWL